MPGISAVKTGIPFSKKGFNFSSYWETRTPTNLILSIVSDTSIKLEWINTGIDFVGHSIERGLDGITYEVIDTVPQGTNEFTDTELTAGTAYFYRIRAYIGTQYSEYLTLSDTYVYYYYWETLADIHAVYYASPTGSGTDSTFASPSTFNTAIGKATTATDVVLMMPGTYNYIDGTELDFKGVGAANVIISGLTKSAWDVIVDFENSGDAVGWIYTERAGTIIQHLTISNFRTSAVTNPIFLIQGNSSGEIRYCRFRDFGRRAITINGSATQGNWKIRKNYFQGVQYNDRSSYNPTVASILIDGSSNPVDVDVEYNVFMPSASNLIAGVCMWGAPATSCTVDFYNNEFYGLDHYAIYSGGNNYTGNMLNNVFMGMGMFANGGLRAMNGAFDGYASTTNYNYVIGSSQKPPYYDSQITPGANDVLGNPSIKATKLPVKSFLLLTHDDASSWNTTGWNNLKTLTESKGWKLSSLINVATWDTLYGGTAPGSELTAYINAGHDVGVHSFSHSPLTLLTAAITLTYTGGGTKNVTIVTDVVGGGADWNGILKDYTQWTGSLVLDVGGAGEDTLNLKDGSKFLTLADVKTWVETHADWTATVSTGDVTHIASATPAISLANITASAIGNPGTALSVEATPYLWMETKYAKDRIEAIINTVTGSSYEVKTWGCPFNLSSIALMDALKEAGYIVARGTQTVTSVLSDASDTYNLAPYCLATVGSDDWTDNTDADFVISLTGMCNTYLNVVGGGGVKAFIVHSDAIDHANELSVMGDIFNILEDFESMGLQVLSMREFADLISGNDFEISAGTVGSDLRLKYTHVEQFDGTKRTGSVCINAGIDVSLASDIEDVAVVAPPNIGAFES